MPIISTEIKNRYPHTAHLLSNLQYLRRDSLKVFNVFAKHAHLDVEYASLVLSLNSCSDKIKPIPTIKLDSHESPIKGWGYYPGIGHDVFLKTEFVAYCENAFKDVHSSEVVDPYGPGNWVRLPCGSTPMKLSAYHGNMRIFFEAIVLHELVHWGRAIKGLSSGTIGGIPSETDAVTKERGWMFVKDAYGSYLHPNQLGI